MAQSKPTPGPWKATAAGIDAVTVSTTLRNGRRVPFRVACCKDGDIDQVQANARLIAAAPELLAALADILFEDSGKSEEARLLTRIKARAAVAMAEGGVS